MRAFDTRLALEKILQRLRFATKLALHRTRVCSFSENICTIPKALDFTYNRFRTAQMLPRIAKGFQTMHWLQVFIVGWLFFGLATVAFLFWLCKRSAAALKDQVPFNSLPPQRAEFGPGKLSSELSA
jgi:hypothetical protein